MRGFGWLVCAVTLALTLGSLTARAGCPNPCKLTVEPPVLSPELECLTLQTRAGGCKCQLSLSLSNACDVAVDAVDFEFTSCRGAVTSDFENPCFSVEPEHAGTYHESYNAVGTHQTQIELSIDGEQHSVSLEANVTKFNDTGCACSLPGSGGAGTPALLGLLLLTLSRRRASCNRDR